MDIGPRYATRAADRLVLGPTNPAFSEGLLEAYFAQGFGPAGIFNTGGKNAIYNGGSITYFARNYREDGVEIGGGHMNASAGHAFYARPPTVSARSFSCLIRFRFKSTTAEFGVVYPYAYGYLSTGDGSSAGLHARFRLAGEGGITTKVSASLTDGRLYTAVLVSDATAGEIRLYVDGALVGTATGGSLISSTGNASNNTYRNYCPTLLGATWLRALTDIEARALSSNPWQLFRRETRRVFAGAAPGTPVLSAATITNITTTTARLGGTLTI